MKEETLLCLLSHKPQPSSLLWMRNTETQRSPWRGLGIHRGGTALESAALPSSFTVAIGRFCVGTGEGVCAWTKLKMMRKKKQTLKMSVTVSSLCCFVRR